MHPILHLHRFRLPHAAAFACCRPSAAFTPGTAAEDYKNFPRGMQKSAEVSAPKLTLMAACAAEGATWQWCSHTLCITHASLERADSVKLDEMVLQGTEEGSKADAVMLDPADLGPSDLTLIGNGWSIPVHRCNHICCPSAILASSLMPVCNLETKVITLYRPWSQAHLLQYRATAK